MATTYDDPTILYSGRLKIVIEIYGVNHEGREVARGRIECPSGVAWEFDDLCSGVGGYFYQGKNAPDTLAACMAAESALSFGSYYSTHNRGDDTPEWAPPAEVADEIESEAEYRSDDTPTGPLPEDDPDPTGYAGDSYVVSTMPPTWR